MLIPVLSIVGMVLKKLERIGDKYIPRILLPMGVLGTGSHRGWTVQTASQGV